MRRSSQCGLEPPLERNHKGITPYEAGQAPNVPIVDDEMADMAGFGQQSILTSEQRNFLD